MIKSCLSTQIHKLQTEQKLFQASNQQQPEHLETQDLLSRNSCLLSEFPEIVGDAGALGRRLNIGVAMNKLKLKPRKTERG